jgi:hypothetical protein
MRALTVALATLFAVPALAAPSAVDEEGAKRAAQTYLDALTGKGDESGKELLLGGATMNAQLFSLENWSFVKKDTSEREEGDLAKALALMNDLDKAGRQTLTALLNADNGGDELTVQEVSQEEANKLMAPTQQKAKKFSQACPVLAYVARVGKEVYWHPKNPLRALISQAGKTGKYTVEYHRWIVETKEGPRHGARQWPLRVLRFKTSKVDTGWKILPASDWNAE